MPLSHFRDFSTDPSEKKSVEITVAWRRRIIDFTIREGSTKARKTTKK